MVNIQTSDNRFHMDNYKVSRRDIRGIRTEVIKDLKRDKDVEAKKILKNNKALLNELFKFTAEYEERKAELPNRVQEVLKKYEDDLENSRNTGDRLMDPDLYEYIEMAGDAGRYLREKDARVNDIITVYCGIEKLGNIIAERLVENGLSEAGDALYNMVIDAKENALKGRNTNCYAPFINKKVADMGLEVAKQKRDYKKGKFITSYDQDKTNYYNVLLLIKLGLVTDKNIDFNRHIVFSTIKKWYEQPITIHNLDDYNFNFESFSTGVKKKI